ncbi:hypothetical protein JCM10512_2587 [Bacteroides reticulotermitis JCM 10512]|uniref:DUF3575 domain-containing protein n=1 Tax=Bacteroides reticulotermitis JCM 10512 TaxID=1445607 RepID=W4UUQ8_9BACE|nr:hypothetical protein JCM10512_2587 [Bacteroides reticulotermitis JCM 10512]
MESPRNSRLQVADTLIRIPAVQVVMRDTVYIRQTDTLYLYKEAEILREPEKAGGNGTDRSLHLALKSNLLYDAALLPNLSLEAYLGNNWSAVVEGNWSWWSKPRAAGTRWYHRVQLAGVELRRWIGTPGPLQGHAIGVYGMGGTYDIRLFPKNERSLGRLSNWSWTAGLSYGYSFPVAKRINVELGLAAGYATGHYYLNDWCVEINEGAKRAEKKLHYWGPTRVGVSLVWLIGTVRNKK